jgi:preprotein translocase subunit YajC
MYLSVSCQGHPVSKAVFLVMKTSHIVYFFLSRCQVKNEKQQQKGMR